MKRWLIWLLILMLALTGCNAEKPNDTTLNTEPVNTTQQPTVPAVSLYISGSTLEQETKGAVKTYRVEGGAISWIANLDGDIVVFASNGEKTTITRLSAQDGIVKAAAQSNALIKPIEGSIGTAENKVAYFDTEQNCIVVLDGMFHEVDQVDLPGSMTGTPVLSVDLKTAFYCVDNEIRAMDLTTGIPRLVCQLNLQRLQIVGLLFDDTILHCVVTDMDGDSYTAFYSAKTGEKIGQDAYLTSIDSWEDNYLVRRIDGPVAEVLVGSMNGALKSFAMADHSNWLYILPKNGVAVEEDEGQTGTTLTAYELSEGKALSAVTLKEIEHIGMLTEDPSGQYVWFSAWDPVDSNVILCQWEYAAAGNDETVRIGTRYTAENPDTAGLAACRKLADDLEKKYYVEILLHTDLTEPSDYSFVPEYQVSAYQKALQALDTAMAKFPDGFFRIVASSSNSPKLYINLVRAIQPNRYDVPALPSGYQYWIDGSAYMALLVNDEVEQKFYHELSHVLDTYVRGKSVHYDYWKDCNPEGFQYDESYTEYEKHADSPYLKSESRAFINAFSMTYDFEDRATVMEYALLDHSGEYFASDIMQAKLKTLCQGIRRAFGWRYYEGTFLWEQYLKESLAYVKKK